MLGVVVIMVPCGVCRKHTLAHVFVVVDVFVMVGVVLPIVRFIIVGVNMGMLVLDVTVIVTVRSS